MVHLDGDAFLAELSKLFQNSKTSGSITLTMKRYDGRTKPIPRDPAKEQVPTESMCLIRAQYKNKKIRTVVHAREVNKFQLAYCSLLKTSITGLKKYKSTKTKSKTM
uniref:Signal recognition particle 14 kDa protein n=1 Tax=Cacopsylla melanoneura TaxID=428564 RepID=A0A8D8RX41_9HEMI